MHAKERLVAMFRHYSQPSQRHVLSDTELYNHMAAESMNIVAESLGHATYAKAFEAFNNRPESVTEFVARVNRERAGNHDLGPMYEDAVRGR